MLKTSKMTKPCSLNLISKVPNPSGYFLMMDMKLHKQVPLPSVSVGLLEFWVPMHTFPFISFDRDFLLNVEG